MLLVAATSVLTWLACLWYGAGPQGDVRKIRYSVPQAVSPQAKAVYERLLPLVAARDAQGQPRSAEAYAARNAEMQAGAKEKNRPLLEKLGVTTRDLDFGGVRAVEISPRNDRDDGTVLLHVHGGGFVLGSAHGSLNISALIAAYSGRRVISVDYTLAPQADFQRVTDEVVAAYEAVLAQGHAAGSIGLIGESAGGNIVAASTLKLRDRGLPMPGALILLSPAVDLAMKGDTDASLGAADPALFDGESLRVAFALYAPPAEWRNPYASPIHGDFSKGYPPVLLQAGTKERLLSDSVRLYQAVKTAGGVAELDVYEGMPHVFQAFMTDAPEQKAAFEAQRHFWVAHLAASGSSQNKQ
ncbi:MAG: alpha/beta hydrolase [Solimonas sp.]